MLSYDLLGYSKFVVELLSAFPDNLKEMLLYAKRSKAILTNLGKEVLMHGECEILDDFTSYKIRLHNSSRKRKPLGIIARIFELTSDLDVVLDISGVFDELKLFRAKVKEYVQENEYTSIDFDPLATNTDYINETDESEFLYEICDDLKKAVLLFLEYKYYNGEKEKLVDFILSIHNVFSLIQDHLSCHKRIVSYLDIPHIAANKEAGKVLEIQLLDVNMDVKQFGEVILSVNSIYDEIKIAIDCNDKLEIVKVESGSLLLAILGNAAIIAFIGSLVIMVIKYIHKKFSKEGKIIEQGELLKVLLTETEIAVKFNELGIKVGPETTEAMRKTYAVAVKKVYKLATSSAIIKVNGELCSIAKEQQAQFIEQAQTVLLSSGEENS
jgi:hypothetical protein